MRIGTNPQKQEKKITLMTHHRIVMVVYIPNEEGFYKNSYDVFKLCLDSLIATINSQAAITVVNNGSFSKVSELLDRYTKEQKIDTLITHLTNIGKIDAQIGAARGAREPLITLTDSDILFVKGWQEKVEEIFVNFPNVGSVSPLPIRKALLSYTSSVLKQILLKKLKFTFMPIPENLENYNRFLVSVNCTTEQEANKMWPVVQKKGVKAIVGSAHQVLTINRDILFTTSPSNPTLTLVGKSSENNYVDIPIDKSGKLRLATFNNFAYHIGNVVEDWMYDVYTHNLSTHVEVKNEKSVAFSPDLFNSKIRDEMYFYKKKFFKKVFVYFFGKG